MFRLSELYRRIPRLSRVLRKGRAAFVLAAAVLVFAATQTERFAAYTPLTKLEQARIDWRFRKRANVPGHRDVVIVGITSSTLDPVLLAPHAGESEALALMAEKPWPWNRKVWALLIERIFTAGARAVAVDVLFPGERDGNDELAKVIAKHRERVTIGSTLQIENNDSTAKQISFILPHASLVPAGKPKVVGYCFLYPEIDNVVRRVSYRTSELREYGMDDGVRDLTALSALGVEKFLGGRVADGDAQLINFQGPKTTYPYLPAEEVFIDSIYQRDPRFRGGEVFRDKLVFIGPIAETFHDEHSTPYGVMPGVEIHAQIAGALLAGTRLRETGPAVNAWLTLGCVAIAAAAVLLIRNALAQVIVLAGAGAIVLLGSQFAFERAQLVMPLVPPLFGLVATGAFGVILLFFIEQMERARIRSVLDKYVSKNVANVVVEQSDAFEQSLRGQKKGVTILFSDIRGFTTMSETRSAERLVGQLNEYFVPMVDAITAEGGTLQKFIGDAIMAAWGDTHSLGHDADATHAVRAALRMRAVLIKLNAEWAGNDERIQLATGIGVNHGEVIVGEIGHPELRKEFTVLGDGVNLAARLESATKQFHCDMLVGERAEELTRGEFVYRRVDRLCFKGKSQPVEVFIALSERAVPAPSWLAGYHAAIERYRGRKFAEAAAAFRAVEVATGGDDFLCRMYAARCDLFTREPPGADWDGSHTLTEK